VMRQLVERGWSRRRISTELGISRHTVSHHNYCLRSPSSEREVIQKTGKSCPLD
jgi:predicted transcriptional regulator